MPIAKDVLNTLPFNIDTVYDLNASTSMTAIIHGTNMYLYDTIHTGTAQTLQWSVMFGSYPHPGKPVLSEYEPEYA